MKYTDIPPLMKSATWLGRQVNNVFGGDTWMGRTFGESAETAAQNFYNKQISPEMQAQRKADAAAADKQLATTRTKVNNRVDTAVANMQQRNQADKARQLAKQKAQDAYIMQTAQADPRYQQLAQAGVKLTPADVARVRQNAQTQQAVAKRKPQVPADNATAQARSGMETGTMRGTAVAATKPRPTRTGYRTPDGAWHPIG
jgi:hypothetical protein